MTSPPMDKDFKLPEGWRSDVADAYISACLHSNPEAAADCILSALTPHVRELVEALEQASRDIGILLASIDFVREATGEGPEDEDAAMVEQIRATRNEELRALLSKFRSGGGSHGE